MVFRNTQLNVLSSAEFATEPSGLSSTKLTSSFMPDRAAKQFGSAGRNFHNCGLKAFHPISSSKPHTFSWS